MKAYVDKDTCIGCELCTQICPDVFSMDDDGKSVAINDDIPERVNADKCDQKQQGIVTDHKYFPGC